MAVEKFSINGICCAAYYLIASQKKYLPIRALRIQAGAFALSLLVQKHCASRKLPELCPGVILFHTLLLQHRFIGQ